MAEISNSEVSVGIPFEVDREVVYLNPHSAEGKALHRIRNPIPEEQWIAVGEIEQDVDMEAVRERIKQRGYKIQISSENSPPSQD